MRDNATVAVRYCGGCNPRCDRVSLVSVLNNLFPEYTFVPAGPGKQGFVSIVVCGCSARCADVADLTGPLIYLNGWEESISDMGGHVSRVMKEMGLTLE